MEKQLKKRPPPWNKGENKNNNVSVRKISKTFKRKGIDNFSVWRQKAKKDGYIPNTLLPFPKDQDLAFLIGLILGDGNINKMERMECLRITLGTDKPKLWKYTAKTIKKSVS